MEIPATPVQPKTTKTTKKAAKTKKKKPVSNQRNDERAAKYTPGGSENAAEASRPSAGAVTRISVKPGRDSTLPSQSPPQPQPQPPQQHPHSPSSRRISVPPEGGYSTGYYRILLETKRVEMLCRSLSLHYRHVAQLHRVFRAQDDYHTGTITIDEFFQAIHDEKRPLTMGIFAYVGLDASTKQLTFDQFVLCVVTFAALSRQELLHYAFTLFDKDASGIMDLRELSDFCGNLGNKTGFFFAKNVLVAQQKLAERDHTGPGAHKHVPGADGLVDFEDLQEGSEHFQVAFYPLLLFQRHIQIAALGEAFWSDVVYKKAQIERIVHYMRLHKGHLPPAPISARLTAAFQYVAFLVTGGGATTVFNGGPIAWRKAAIAKYEEEMRQRQEEAEAARLAKEEKRRLERIAEGEGEGGERGGGERGGGGCASSDTPVVAAGVETNIAESGATTKTVKTKKVGKKTTHVAAT